MARSRATQNGNRAFATVSYRSPLARTCPECGAAIGEHCWAKGRNGGKVLYPRRIMTAHKGRRTPREKKS